VGLDNLTLPTTVQHNILIRPAGNTGSAEGLV
jgi:hypothetical protein